MDKKQKIKTTQQKMYLLIAVVAVGFILSTLVSSYSLSNYSVGAEQNTQYLLDGQQTSDDIQKAELFIRLKLAQVLRGYVEVENAFSLSEEEINALRKGIVSNIKAIDQTSSKIGKITNNALVTIKKLELSSDEMAKIKATLMKVKDDFLFTATAIQSLAEKANEIEFSSLKEETQAVLDASDQLEKSTQDLQSSFSLLRLRSQAQLNALKHKYITELIGASLVLFLLASGLAIRMSASISKRLAGTIKALEALGNGDTTNELKPSGANDDIALLRQAYRNLRAGVIEQEKMARQEKERELVEKEKNEAIANMCASFDTNSSALVASLNKITDELNQTGNVVSLEANETAQSSTQVSSSASDASDDVRNVAAATEQLSASVAQVVSQAQETSQRSNSANDSVKQAIQNSVELEEASQSINSVLGIIQDLAEQTNLLALNATIEAGRAGEAGKGFAVVASEVKLLSKQTSEAADEIAQRISAMKNASSNVSNQLNQVNERVEDISVMSRETVQAMEEQNAAICEISKNIDAISLRLQNVDQETSRLSTSSERSRNAATMLNELVEKNQSQAQAVAQAFTSFTKDIRHAQDTKR
ncbi:MAG: hypothetical protein HWE34_17525 [Methylocystaceae bacterium]|nr:hypothetical protein [Methylocystaceae bacterium]